MLAAFRFEPRLGGIACEWQGMHDRRVRARREGVGLGAARPEHVDGPSFGLLLEQRFGGENHPRRVFNLGTETRPKLTVAYRREPERGIALEPALRGLT